MDFPGEKLVIRLWETLAEKGVGSLLRPWQIRREGRARIDLRKQEMLALAQTERDSEDIRLGRKRLSHQGDLITLPAPSIGAEAETPAENVEPNINLQLLAEIASNTAQADSMRREINVSKALLYAEAELEQDPQDLPSSKVDEDWLFRWRDSASNVSTEKMQELWGRVLAGEVKSPGSFSLRTLEFLRNLSQPEAEAVAKLSRFAVAGAIILIDEKFLEDEGMDFDFFIEMQDLGVLTGVESIGFTITWRTIERNMGFVTTLLSHGKAFIVRHNDAQKTITLPAYKLTSIGSQVLKLGKFDPHETYLHKVGDAIKAQGFEVELANFVIVNDKQIRCFDSKKL